MQSNVNFTRIYSQQFDSDSESTSEVREADYVPELNNPRSTVLQISRSVPALLHHESAFDFVRTGMQPRSCCNISFSVRKRLLFFLIFLGLVAGSIDLLIREAIARISLARERVSDAQDNVWIGYACWASSATGLILLAIGWTHLFEDDAVGSGLPQIKTLLTGSDIPCYLSISMLIAKIGGLIAASSSGLSIGREGPFVHISCIISHQLLRLPWFKEFREHKSYRLQLIATAAAVGVAANFSSPVGGVLFSIEVTSTYYLLDNYWKSFASAISGAVASTMLRVVFTGDQGFSQLFQTNFPLAPYRATELGFFLLLGLIMGILGGSLVRLFSLYGRKLRSLSQRGDAIRRWYLPVLVILVTSSITYCSGEFMTCSLTKCTNTLVSEKDLPNEWHNINIYVSLAIFGLVYYILTPISILLPVPAGVFIPAFASGAAMGRLFGTLLQEFVYTTGKPMFPGGYAIAGGAAMAAGVTRTISSAVIALEFTGQQNYILPVFLAVIPAYGVGSIISKGLFDVILIARGLPYLPINRYDKTLKVGSIMSHHVLKLTKTATYARVLLAINLMNRRTIPVVNDSTSLLLMGVVPKDRLMKMMRKFYSDNDLSNVEQDMGSPGPPPSSGSVNGNGSYIRRSIATFRSLFHEPESGQSSFHQSWMQSNRDGIGIQGMQNEQVLLQFMTNYWDKSKKEIMNRSVDILDQLGQSVLTPTVLTVPKETPIEEAHIIFVMMRCQKLYVTHFGALCGEVTVEDMAKNHAE